MNGVAGPSRDNVTWSCVLIMLHLRKPCIKEMIGYNIVGKSL